MSTEGMAARIIAEKLGIAPLTVDIWRRRFRESGIAGLSDRKRSGRPTVLRKAVTQRVLDLATHRMIPTGGDTLEHATHGQVRQCDQWQARQIWEAADLEPHRFKTSNDPHFAEKAIDAVGLYMDPTGNAVVLSVAEEAQIQTLDQTQSLLPLRPGQPGRRTNDYKRHGIASLYTAFDIASGEVRGRETKRHRSKELHAFLRQIERAIDPDLQLHLILFNSSNHKTQAIRDFLERQPRFHSHFTPTSASWLDAVERWFSQLEHRPLYRGLRQRPRDAQ